MEPPRWPPRIPHHPRAIGNRRGPPRGAVRCGARPRIAPRRHRHGGATPRRAEANPAAGRDAAPCALLARLPVAAAVYSTCRGARTGVARLEGSCECGAAEGGGGGRRLFSASAAKRVALCCRGRRCVVWEATRGAGGLAVDYRHGMRRWL